MYYTFEDVSGSKSVVKDLSGNGGDLKYVPYIDRSTKEIFDDIKVVVGRWADKNAVRLDRGFYQGPTYNIENRQFTAEVWFRRIAPGSIVSASKRKDGHIMSVSGYTQGWRIYTTYDPVSGVILGVGKTGGCNIRINAAITDNQWQHLVFTWDGKTINLYLNGVLISSTGFEEEYIAVGNPNQFKIGFSELGVGSIIVDIDEIILYNRVLTGKEVEELSKGPEGFSQKEIFEKADTFIKNRDYNKVRAEYEKLKRFPNNGL